MSNLWNFDRGENLEAFRFGSAFFDVAAEVEDCLLQYRQTGNGIFVWRAWRIARVDPERKMTPRLQEYFARYFDDCARGLMQAETNTGIAQALHLSTPKGGRGEGKQVAQDQSNAFWMLRRFNDLLEQENASEAEHVGKKKPRRRAEERLGRELGIGHKAVQKRIQRALKSRAKNYTLLLERE